MAVGLEQLSEGAGALQQHCEGPPQHGHQDHWLGHSQTGAVWACVIGSILGR